MAIASAKALDLRQLQKQLDQKDPKPLYFLMGEEPFLLNEAVQLLRQKTLNEGATDFNFDSYIAGEVSVAHIKDTVETLPIMCPRRLVILRDVHILKDKDWQALEPILVNPVESTVLVMLADKLDKRKKAYKTLSQSAVVAELKPPYDNQIPAWIDYISYKQGLALNDEAIASLQQLVGNNLSEIANELAKVRAYIGNDRNDVKAQDILRVVSQTRVESIFDLASAIGKKDRAMALVCLARLLEQGQNEIGVLALVWRHFRILSSLQEGRKAGLSGQRLSTKAGIPYFFLKDYMEQSRHWSGRKISQTIHALQETDKALKSSPVSGHIWLENFIVRTCSA